MQRLAIALTIIFAPAATVRSEERFITIQQVVGNRIAFVECDKRATCTVGACKAATWGKVKVCEAGECGAGAVESEDFETEPLATTPQTITAIIPADAKITAAMRERRTFEFRVGIELAGGMRHPVFTECKSRWPHGSSLKGIASLS